MNELLKDHKLKSTPKRETIITVMENHSQPMTIEQIHDLASNVTAMNLSTVYRTITTLYDHNIVQETINQEGKSYYQLNRHKHEHYLICRSCKKIIPFECCPLQDLEERLQKETGFQITDHKLEFSGLCPDCQKQTHTKKGVSPQE